MTKQISDLGFSRMNEILIPIKHNSYIYIWNQRYKRFVACDPLISTVLDMLFPSIVFRWSNSLFCLFKHWSRLRSCFSEPQFEVMTDLSGVFFGGLGSMVVGSIVEVCRKDGFGFEIFCLVVRLNTLITKLSKFRLKQKKSCKWCGGKWRGALGKDDKWVNIWRK